MDKVVCFASVLALFLTVVSGQGFYNSAAQRSSSVQWHVKQECGECNPGSCERPVGCVAGLVKDDCDCCDVCGKAEFELCDHPEVPQKPGFGYGKCGDNLDCRLRDDLEDEGPEAICYCRIDGTLCGTDGRTYDNLCQLVSAGVREGTKITIQEKGPCNEGKNFHAISASGPF